MRTAAIVLAGGSGSRMNSAVKKQYLLLGDRPVLWYSLQVFQNCPRIDEIVLICGAGEVEFCRREFADQYGFTKITHIAEGGRERYDSVYEGLRVLDDCDFVLIHDGARPFIDQTMLDRIFETICAGEACVVGMPVKDTIKMRDEEGYVADTLPREKLWMIQTPQAFPYSLIRKAYENLRQETIPPNDITDDAMVVERCTESRIRLIEGSYDNIKITTPEDLISAKMIAKRYRKDRENRGT